jgi:hypothetical protein
MIMAERWILVGIIGEIMMTMVIRHIRKEACSFAIFYTVNPTRNLLGSNTVYRGEKPGNNCVHYGTDR